MTQICTICGENHNQWYTCQSWKDVKKSIDIARNHKLGQYCKEWQHCSHCCYIKHEVKVLRHFSGACKNNKRPNRCPVCFEQRTSGYNIESCYARGIEKRVKQLYIMMLFGKISLKF